MLNLWPVCADALKNYIKEAKAKEFPNDVKSFEISDEELEKFVDYIKNNEDRVLDVTNP